MVEDPSLRAELAVLLGENMMMDCLLDMAELVSDDIAKIIEVLGVGSIATVLLCETHAGDQCVLKLSSVQQLQHFLVDLAILENDSIVWETCLKPCLPSALLPRVEQARSLTMAGMKSTISETSFDMGVEATNLHDFSKLVEEWGPQNNVHFPAVKALVFPIVKSITVPLVLKGTKIHLGMMMSYLSGSQIRHKAKASLEERNRLASSVIEVTLWMIQHGLIHEDLHAANILVDDCLKLLDFGEMMRLSPKESHLAMQLMYCTVLDINMCANSLNMLLLEMGVRVKGNQELMQLLAKKTSWIFRDASDGLGFEMYIDGTPFNLEDSDAGLPIYRSTGSRYVLKWHQDRWCVVQGDTLIYQCQLGSVTLMPPGSHWCRSSDSTPVDSKSGIGLVFAAILAPFSLSASGQVHTRAEQETMLKYQSILVFPHWMNCLRRACNGPSCILSTLQMSAETVKAEMTTILGPFAPSLSGEALGSETALFGGESSVSHYTSFH